MARKKTSIYLERHSKKVKEIGRDLMNEIGRRKESGLEQGHLYHNSVVPQPRPFDVDANYAEMNPFEIVDIVAEIGAYLHISEKMRENWHDPYYLTGKTLDSMHVVMKGVLSLGNLSFEKEFLDYTESLTGEVDYLHKLHSMSSDRLNKKFDEINARRKI